MTSPEKLFWSKIANRSFLGLKFRKQHGIGSYIIDFYCAEKKLIIEIDGESHAESMLRDEQRTNYLRSLGYTEVRYNNRDVLNNTDGVFEDLAKQLSVL